MRKGLIASISLMVGGVAVGCSGDDCSSNCVSPDGSADANADVVVDAATESSLPPGCDLSADIASSPACIDDGIGVFVDATNGNDTNAGTKASPFKTIGHAIAAVGVKQRVYVCDGTYAEDVSLTQTNAVEIFGGVQCGTWTYDGNQPTIGASNLALHIDGVQKPLVVSDLTFQPTAGSNPGDSSIAAFVNASIQVTLRRVRLLPAAGVDGKNGTTGSNWTAVAQSDASIAGKNASGTGGGASHACTLCANNVNSTGGAGGNGGLSSTGGSDGAPNLNGQSPADGKGGNATCTSGDNGASATAGPDAIGATSIGKLSSTSWLPAAGEDGASGGPGQGGGGGGGASSITSGGGAGGGCGGCGGAGGTGGGGGGASIGLASVSSSVALVSCNIATQAGGKGGSGATGQDGQLGGYAGTLASPGCAGGVGGQGAKGSAGGGGAGGSSVGILYTGEQPNADTNTTITVPSTAASKGTGGNPGLNDGVAGACEVTLQATSS